MTEPQTDKQIIEETNELARFIMAELIGNTGYQVPEGHKFYEAEDPRSKKAWDAAVKIMEMTTKTEMADVLATLEEEPLEREYGVRLWATFRACAETSVTATSFAEAVTRARELDHGDFDFKIEEMDGDETLHVFGPDDDNPGDDDAWGGDGVEVDKRSKGEPFSWDACQLVKELAAFHGKGWDPKAIISLITRAKAACTKEN